MVSAAYTQRSAYLRTGLAQRRVAKVTALHLTAGIRHLIWDAGYALELSSAYASGYISLVASFLLTGAAWALAILV